MSGRELKLKKFNYAVFDVETTPTGNLVLIGCIYRNRYRYFIDAQSFLNYLYDNKIRQVFAHNLEYDFTFIMESIPKFNMYYTTAGLSYIQAGAVIFKDSFNHLPYRLETLGTMLGIEKGKIDYDNISVVTPELIEYNKTDCIITDRIVKRLKKLYFKERCTKIKSTVGSQAMDIYLKRFYCGNFYKIPDKILELWRQGYKGGICRVYYNGKFTGDLYKIDANSLFPMVMKSKYPYPYEFIISEKVKKDNNLFLKYPNFIWVKDGTVACNYDCNYRELPFKIFDKVYFFKKYWYPFRYWVEYFYNKKIKATGIDKIIYKRLLNSLYGKFGQKAESVQITKGTDISKLKDVIAVEEYDRDLLRITKKVSNRYWVNVVLSLFTTAKARRYINKIQNFIIDRGLKVLYLDTDGFIVKGNLDNIKNILHSEKLGAFKIEDYSNSVEIKGKKLYRFGNKYYVKGIPKKSQEEFFNSGVAKFKKFIRLREGLRSNLRPGAVIEDERINKKNSLTKAIKYV